MAVHLFNFIFRVLVLQQFSCIIFRQPYYTYIYSEALHGRCLTKSMHYMKLLESIHFNNFDNGACGYFCQQVVIAYSVRMNVRLPVCSSHVVTAIWAHFAWFTTSHVGSFILTMVWFQTWIHISLQIHRFPLFLYFIFCSRWMSE